MSENQDSKPMTKTSAVPIRKETVRVTLKAPQPGAGPTAPPAPLPPSAVAPSAVAPMAPPTGVVQSSSPKPAAPAPTAPLRAPNAPAGAPPAPAPTVRLNTGPGSGPATQLATPAPTVRLNTPVGGAGTVPLATGAPTGQASQQLPKATVRLAQTQPMDAPAAQSQAATIQTIDDDGASEGGEGAAKALSIVSLVAALILLGVQLSTAGIWVDGNWGSLLGL